MPALAGLDGLIADAGVDLRGELRVVEAQGQAVGDQLVKHVGRGHPGHVLVVGGEGLEHGVAHGRGLLLEQLPETQLVDGFLLTPEVVIESDAQETAADQDAA